MRGEPLALSAPSAEQIFLVSPPVTPPWRNGSVLLARDLAMGADRFRYRVLGSKGQRDLPKCSAHVEGFYRGSGAGLTDKLRLVARLLRPDGCKVQHFFFAPNKRSSQMARFALRLNRKRAVHTLPSLPPEGVQIVPLMFADRVVVLSEASAVLLRSAGVDDVRVVRPGVSVPSQIPSMEACRQNLVAQGILDLGRSPAFLYAGDLEFSNGADIFAKAVAVAVESMPEASFIFACRPKTQASQNALQSVQNMLEASKASRRCTFLGMVQDMPTLMGAVDALVLPVDSLYAKVDMPYVLLEAMAVGRPVIVSDLAPLTELAGLSGGAIVVPRSDPLATAAAMVELGKDRAGVERLGRLARSSMTLNFRIEDMVARYEALYEELL
jgi:phosphatidylinositol alpha-1,6-mannosyltransferase